MGTKRLEKRPKYYIYNRIVKAKLFIDDNYFRKIDLENISNEAYFSKFHFIRLFRKIYGKTPHQYLIQVRIDKAKSFLEQNMNISEVCVKVGFESFSSFTSLFKKNTKKTPSEYQNLYNIRIEKIKSSPLKFIPNCFAERRV